jgi:hypothetical protein
MRQPNFLLWRAHFQDGFCLILPPEGIEKSYQLNRGISRVVTWPSDVVCRMNPDFPKDIQLSDNLKGTGFAVISTAVKEAILKENVTNVEFLPITILNHKGRVASTEYHIMNPLEVIDCIDVDRSGVRWSRIDPSLITSCRSLVLKPEAVPESTNLFRLKSLPMEIAVRKTLVDKLLAEPFMGLSFKDPVEFTGIG